MCDTPRRRRSVKEVSRSNMWLRERRRGSPGFAQSDKYNQQGMWIGTA
jgi:hypothetical protein